MKRRSRGGRGRLEGEEEEEEEERRGLVGGLVGNYMYLDWGGEREKERRIK